MHHLSPRDLGAVLVIMAEPVFALESTLSARG